MANMRKVLAKSNFGRLAVIEQEIPELVAEAHLAQRLEADEHDRLVERVRVRCGEGVVVRVDLRASGPEHDEAGVVGGQVDVALVGRAVRCWRCFE